MPNFYITTLGCKVNQSETETIARRLEEAGWTFSQNGLPADLCIINTCTVTQKASMQSRQAIRQIVRKNPGAWVIVTGCYASTEPDAIKTIEGVHQVIGHSDKDKIPEMILAAVRRWPGDKKPASCETDGTISHECKKEGGRKIRTRPFLKIQDGCNAFCTYCIVPYARGRSKSLPPDEVIRRLEGLNRNGYREVVLTGIHIGCYGLDLTPATRLSDLLVKIRDEAPVRRIRISSIEPRELTDDIIRLVGSSDIFCNHFHIPLQSGDDQILKRMHRPYDQNFFRQLVLKLNKTIPGIAIGVDVLVGFPGETEAAFDNTYALIKELPVTYLHVFPYSPRQGTPASGYPDQVPAPVVKKRCQRLRALGNIKRANFYMDHIGKCMEVLVEGKRDPSTGWLKGITDNYIPLIFEGDDCLKEQFFRVRYDQVLPDRPIRAIPC